MRIRKTSVYKKWIKGLRDSQARYRILIRIKRLEEGNPGDVKAVGDKSTQQADIARAKQIAALPLEEEE